VGAAAVQQTGDVNVANVTLQMRRRGVHNIVAELVGPAGTSVARSDPLLHVVAAR
jgi:hypothetical protein